MPSVLPISSLKMWPINAQKHEHTHTTMIDKYRTGRPLVNIGNTPNQTTKENEKGKKRIECK